ncbi:MAG: hypothetical protein IJ685_00650, partial [Selenomonadaceae bacterium]|nr:hypothetical protein [Selenomonadaceae bacterium]
NDIFVYETGKDVITDYVSGDDKISLGAAVTSETLNSKGDIVLNFGDDKSLTIQDGDGKKINFIQNGRSSTEIFTSGGKTNTAGTSITLASSTENYTASKVMKTIDGGLTDNVWITGNDAANKIFGGNGDDTLFGGAKNDTLTGNDGNDIFVYETGKDVITDYVSGDDKISLGAAVTSETLNSKGDVVLKFGTNSLTIKSDGNTTERTITFAGEDGDTTKTYFKEQIVGEDGVTLQSAYKADTYTATDDLPKVDASAVTKKFTLTGGSDDNTLIGGRGANLLNGNAGDDLLIGGGGNDTFVYSSGNDTIGDYGNGTDKISLTSAIKDFNLEGDDVIIEFASGSLMLQDSAGKAITFVETVNGKVTTSVNVFAADGILNNKVASATAATIAASTTTFDAKNYSKLVSIDGGLATGDVEIFGNAKGNLIYAGDNGSTINGGGGNDSLWGGSGSDTFIYSSGGGNDTIYDFADDDALQFSGNFEATVKDNSIAFKVGSTANAITLKDYSADTFTINGTDYQVSGSKLVNK